MNSPVEATILTVDDDPVNRKIIVQILKRDGYRVVEADSGLKTLEVLRQVRPDLILLDVMMPGMDGYELCAKLQDNSETADIPVVFLTGLGEKRNRTQGFALGAVEYVTKPVQSEALSRLVAAQLQTSRRWKTLREQSSRLRSLKKFTPTDFADFKNFLFEQLHVSDEAKVACAKSSPLELYAELSAHGFDENQVALSVANFMRLAYLPSVESEDVQVGVLSPQFAKANAAVAITREGKNMFALSNPFDMGLIEALTKFSGLGGEFALGITAPKNIDALFSINTLADPQQMPSERHATTTAPPTQGTYQASMLKQPGRSTSPISTNGFSGAAAVNSAATNLDHLSRDAMLATESVLRLADRLLEIAVSERASDIHIEPKGGDSIFRLRVDGDMREIRPQHLPERLTHGEVLHARELGRLFERAPQDETQHAAEPAENECHAPAVERHERRIHVGSNRQAHTGRHRHTHRHAGEHDAADEGRDSRRRFDDVGQRTWQLAAETEALDQSQRHHQQAGGDTNLRIRRDEAHAERCGRHDEHRPEEHSSAAVAIAVVRQHDTADRPRQVADCERGERHDQRDDRVVGGSEHGLADVAREHAEDHEVVKLERAAEAGEEDDPPAGRSDPIGICGH